MEDASGGKAAVIPGGGGEAQGLELAPGEGWKLMLNLGVPGSLSAMTQFAAVSSTRQVQQDGYGMGCAEDFKTGPDSVITVFYSNGIT